MLWGYPSKRQDLGERKLVGMILYLGAFIGWSQKALTVGLNEKDGITDSCCATANSLGSLAYPVGAPKPHLEPQSQSQASQDAGNLPEYSQAEEVSLEPEPWLKEAADNLTKELAELWETDHEFDDGSDEDSYAYDCNGWGRAFNICG